MLKLTKKNKSEQQKVQKYCANYNAGFKCSGVIISNKLQQVINSELENKLCLISEGKTCSYYDQCVKPIVDS